MLYSHRIPLYEHPDDVEAIGIVRTAMPVDPDRRRPGELALLSPVHGLDRITELVSASSFHFDERDQPVSFGYQIDIAMAAAESPLEDPPPPPTKPPLSHPLTNLAEFLPRR